MFALEKEVDFQNIVPPQATVPVKLGFVLALEQPKTQIDMLQKIALPFHKTTLVSSLLEINPMLKTIII